MQALETSFTAACAEGRIPGAILVASNKTGSFQYAKAFGLRSLVEGKQSPLDTGDVVALYSSTKLVTTIAVLQLIERGQAHLEDDVAPIIPEITEQQILTGMKSGKGQFVKRRNHITLR